MLLLRNLISKEPFVGPTVYLLGDSSLDNVQYVGTENSVHRLVQQHVPGVVQLAKDSSTVSDLAVQVSKVPCAPATVCVSCGGNDILRSRTGRADKWKLTLKTVFERYKKALLPLVKCPETRLILLDVYYPKETAYERYYPLIAFWNGLLKSYASEHKLRLITVSGVLNSRSDFVQSIEPSATGGLKIAKSITEVQ